MPSGQLESLARDGYTERTSASRTAPQAISSLAPEAALTIGTTMSPTCRACGKPLPAFRVSECPNCQAHVVDAPPPQATMSEMIRTTVPEPPPAPPVVAPPPLVPPPLPAGRRPASPTVAIPTEERSSKRRFAQAAALIEEELEIEVVEPPPPPAPTPAKPATRPQRPAPAGVAEELAFHPTIRPPMAMICVVDDGVETGEWVRVRAARCVVGRSEGDVVIGHDALISSAHLEFCWQQTAVGWRWVARDLGSTNGSFARVTIALLPSNQEFLIGSRRYRFELPEVPSPDNSQLRATINWKLATPTSMSSITPSIVEIQTDAAGRRYPLVGHEAWIGSDASQVDIAITDDPFVAPRHARIVRDELGKWNIHTGKTKNGVWARFREVVIESHGEFQIGEQRLIVKVPR